MRFFTQFLCCHLIFLEKLDTAATMLGTPNHRYGRIMKQISWKACSALIHQCLFPQIMPGSSSAVLHHRSATTALTDTREQTMLITVERADVTRLRQVIMQSCGSSVNLMRMSPLDHARRMQLRLSVPSFAISLLIDAVLSALPQAEFGLPGAAH